MRLSRVNLLANDKVDVSVLILDERTKHGFIKGNGTRASDEPRKKDCVVGG